MGNTPSTISNQQNDQYKLYIKQQERKKKIEQIVRSHLEKKKAQQNIGLQNDNSHNIHSSSNRMVSFLNEEDLRRRQFEKEQQQRRKEFENSQKNRRSSFENEIKKFTTSGFDPYKILNIQRNANIDTIKQAYKKLALITHPDKGGNSDLFSLVTKAYMTLVDEYKKRAEERQFNELKSDFKNYTENTPKTTNPHFSKDFNLNMFNKIYSENVLYDPNQEGYGDIMMKRSKQRVDIDIPRIFGDRFNKNVFNRTFENIKSKIQSTEIVKYSEPEAMNMNTGSTTIYEELGQGKIDDFSSSYNLQNNGVQYTDYKKAHTNAFLINPNSVSRRTEYKNINELQSSRSNISMKMSDRDINRYEMDLENNERQEWERQNRIKEQQKIIYDHYKKVNRRFITR